jgi:hypothetical protein
MRHVWETGKVHTGIFSGDIRERDHLEDHDVDGRIILSLIFKKWDTGTWTGLLWLSVGTGGGLL